MDWVLLVLGTVLSVETARRLPLGATLGSLARTARKAQRILASAAISDHWKERALPKLARRMFFASMGLLLSLIAIVAPLLLGVALSSALGGGVAGLLLDPLGLVVMLAAAAAWLGGRRALRHV